MMTENERFSLAYEIGDWWAVNDGDITLWKEEVVSLLNELSEENEQLKQFPDRVFNIIDENIDELQKKYDFGQKNRMCPMYNILHSINTLKDLKKELEE